MKSSEFKTIKDFMIDAMEKLSNQTIHVRWSCQVLGGGGGAEPSMAGVEAIPHETLHLSASEFSCGLILQGLSWHVHAHLTTIQCLFLLKPFKTT